ncbi:MAG: helix-turn-helix domain-containing protein [Gemmatimonadota bacterium]
MSRYSLQANIPSRSSPRLQKKDHDSVIGRVASVRFSCRFSIPVNEAARHHLHMQNKARGARIREAIKKAGLTQSEAATACGVARKSVVLWLAGGEIAEDSLAQLCKLTGNTPAWIRYGMSPGEGEADDRFVAGFAAGKAAALASITRAIAEIERCKI